MRSKKKILQILIIIMVIILAFFAGAKWREFSYDDMCLDLGGGKNPGNYPICVVEVEK